MQQNLRDTPNPSSRLDGLSLHRREMFCILLCHHLVRAHDPAIYFTPYDYFRPNLQYDILLRGAIMLLCSTTATRVSRASCTTWLSSHLLACLRCCCRFARRTPHPHPARRGISAAMYGSRSIRTLGVEANSSPGSVGVCRRLDSVLSFPPSWRCNILLPYIAAAIPCHPPCGPHNSTSVIATKKLWLFPNIIHRVMMALVP